MLNWLKQKLTGEKQNWHRAQQVPGTKFLFPKGSKLRADDDVILAVPETIISGDETIGSVFLCDDNAEIMLNEKVGAWYVKLGAGMTFSLAKSCEVMLVAADDRPRFFSILASKRTAV